MEVSKGKEKESQSREGKEEGNQGADNDSQFPFADVGKTNLLQCLYKT